MSIRQIVLDYVRDNAGKELSAEDVRAALEPLHAPFGPSREQISNSLADLATWSEIVRVRRGVYAAKPEGEPELATPNGVLSVGSVSDTIKEDETADDKFFTQVGITLEEGYPIITRDSDGVAYKAIPL